MSEPVSTAVGIASLTFQVFSGCVKGYQLLTDAHGMPKEFQYLRVRLKTEQYRLLDWAHVAQLNERDENLLISNASKGLLMDVLDQQERLLQRFGRLDDKYAKLRRPLLSDVPDGDNINGYPDEPPAYSEQGPSSAITRVESGFQDRFPQSETLLQKSLALVENTRRYPARLKWASWDRAKVEGLLLKLSAFNDFMKELLNTRQLEMLAEKQMRTDFQIMQLNSKMDQLIQIFESGTVLTLTGVRTRAPMDPLRAFLQSRGIDDSHEMPPEKMSRHHLAELAQFKALNSAIDTNTLTDEFAKDLALGQTGQQIMSVELKRAHIHLLDPADPGASAPENERAEAYYQPSAHRRRQQVWIEWKTFEPATFSGEPDPKILERVQALAALLRENNRTDRFRAPHCLGYFRDADAATHDDRGRFGLVFEKPVGVHPATRPVSLLELLRDPAIEMPSLTERVALARAIAECIERLHAVNWLHKGLRSDNIIFFSETRPRRTSGGGVVGVSAASPTTTSSSTVADAATSGAQPTTSSTTTATTNAAAPAPPGEKEDADIDFSQPFISGFDYSRPAQNEDMTEKPPENAAYDLYRHPRVHGSLGGATTTASSWLATASAHSRSSPTPSPGGGHTPARQPSPRPASLASAAAFKKSYDIYALGVTLLEIAFWAPIDRVLGIADVRAARPSTTIRVRHRLLHDRQFLGHVRAHLGFTFEGVVRACLEGPGAFGIDEGADEREEVVGEELQRQFYKRVVERLGEMRL